MLFGDVRQAGRISTPLPRKRREIQSSCCMRFEAPTFSMYFGDGRVVHRGGNARLVLLESTDCPDCNEAPGFVSHADSEVPLVSE